MATYGGLNIGTHRSIKITNNRTLSNITLGGRILDLHDNASLKLVESEPIDNGGLPELMPTYGAHKGTITVERSGPDAEALQAYMEGTYFNGGQYDYYTITETTFNPADGTTSKFAYINCVIDLSSVGPWSKAETVKMKIDYTAQQKKQIQ